jgi:uncharacterized membrane protein YkvA (DUF1232 family)
VPIEVTFTLSDADLQRFQAIIDKARDSVVDDRVAKEIEEAARELIAETEKSELPEFIASRLQKLSVLIEMINDEEWQLPEDDRRRIVSALAYLCNPDDLIPDHIPGLGFLDDAIYAEIIIGELRDDVETYLEFCAYREREEQRRLSRGEDVKIGREEWLAKKRANLHTELKKRRLSRRAGGQWRLRLF